MTIFGTVLSGVLVFVLGQIILKLLIEPIQSYKKHISKIGFDLIKFGNVLGNPKGKEDTVTNNACTKMRSHSSSLYSYLYLVPFYKVTCRIFNLPTEDDVLEATKELIGLSNGYDGELANQGTLNSYSAQKVKVALGIAIPKSEWLEPENEIEFIKSK
ncbi:hypothetical protein HJ030_17640 [Vibrio parahaemolyticus]|jgi:hypothetical protein|uniref:hypothetical protein n=1 Tax=Vibrio parahaemolyticus TaxID=670 RepID=UPI0011106DC3|nr:hypothetical protein [Vibrio parahaemolyticus]MBE4384979.1 hypothetical protein [Vibrio parahaemolyticus]MEA5230254.1 hypothetical protein [Vibrio parahaemolyticus]TMX39619.1 hypothetical protein DA098_10045 [Vibrio parahaemolyticus]TMX80314.1 hypothetical protein DA094_01930 [Vibrio parahaemolyticus]